MLLHTHMPAHAQKHSVHPPPFLLGEGGVEGLKLLPNFQKGGVDRTSTLRGGLLEKREVTFFRGVAILQKNKQI